MVTREETRQAREAKLDELHERLTGAVEQLVSGDDWGRALAFAARFRTRSLLTHPGVSGDWIPWKDLSHGTSQQVPA